MTYKKLETISISGTVATVAIYLVAAILGGPQVQLFHLSSVKWETLFSVVKFVAVFLIGVSVGAAFVEKE
jgi:hypothetical protein